MLSYTSAKAKVLKATLQQLILAIDVAPKCWQACIYVQAS